MPAKKGQYTSKKAPSAVRLSPEKQALATMILKWSRMVDNPKKKKESDALFRKIWDMRHGDIHPF